MFKSLSLTVPTLLLAVAFPAFAAPPQMDTLAIRPSEAGWESGCTPDKLCVDIAPSQTDCEGSACADLRLTLSGQRDPAPTPYRLTGRSSADKDASPRLWPKLIRFEGGILAGVETQVQAMYSGGGGRSTTLHLIAFLPGQPPFEVLRVPRSASLMIRACFSERDMRQRADVCHDVYNFDASLAPAGISEAGMPLLHYRSEASAFPGPVSRSKDSLAGQPLRKRDIVTVTDPRCSYQRAYRFVPEARAYLPDTPSPDCSDYTVP